MKYFLPFLVLSMHLPAQPDRTPEALIRMPILAGENIADFPAIAALIRDANSRILKLEGFYKSWRSHSSDNRADDYTGMGRSCHAIVELCKTLNRDLGPVEGQLLQKAMDSLPDAARKQIQALNMDYVNRSAITSAWAHLLDALLQSSAQNFSGKTFYLKMPRGQAGVLSEFNRLVGELIMKDEVDDKDFESILEMTEVKVSSLKGLLVKTAEARQHLIRELLKGKTVKMSVLRMQEFFALKHDINVLQSRWEERLSHCRKNYNRYNNNEKDNE